MYYRIVNDAGIPMETGNNAQSERELKNAVLSLLAPEVSDEDLRDYGKATLRSILAGRGWTLENQDEPFPGEDYDLEGEVNWDWAEYIDN